MECDWQQLGDQWNQKREFLDVVNLLLELSERVSESSWLGRLEPKELIYLFIFAECNRKQEQFNSVLHTMNGIKHNFISF